MDLLASLFARFQPKPVDLIAAGQRALMEADRLWRRDIIDPPRGATSSQAKASLAAIDEMIRGADGLGWTWLTPYEGDGRFEWCGAYVASCWATAGLRLELRRDFYASTFRLDCYARYLVATGPKNPKPAMGPYRMIIDLNEKSRGDLRFDDGTAPRAGDILMIGPVGSGPGKHITLVETYNAGTFSTVEGNSVGIGPKGDRRQGVIRNFRQLGLRVGQAPTTYHARRLIRPAPADLA